MQRFLAAIALTSLLAATAPALADPVYNTYVTSAADLDSSRAGPSQIYGNAGYVDFSVKWTITQNTTTGVWTYSYTFADAGQGNQLKDISHVILELSEGATLNEFSGLDGDVGTYMPNPGNKSNPGLPGDIYGVKVGGSSPSLDLVFTTLRAPVWGNFYVKDGTDSVTKKDNYAYNTGFDDLQSTDTLKFIARPDGQVTPVPEPASLAIVAVGGLAGFIALRRNRRRG